jgi:hypothetical protein
MDEGRSARACKFARRMSDTLSKFVSEAQVIRHFQVFVKTQTPPVTNSPGGY